MKLNIGCGPVVPDGWVNVDPLVYPEWGNSWVVAACPGAEKQAASTGGIYRGDPLDGLRWADDTAEGAVAHHVLEMVAWPDLVPWLTEVRRVLRPGGWLRLSVPDLELASYWLDGGDEAPPIADEHEASIDGKVCLWLSQAGATRSVFTGQWLIELCQRAGYTRCTRPSAGRSNRAPQWLASLDDQPDRSAESAYVEARA